MKRSCCSYREGGSAYFHGAYCAIVVDAILGALGAIRGDQEGFSFHELPRYLKTNILPYVGGLGVLALGAELLSAKFFAPIFLVSAVAAGVKYGLEIGEKIFALFGHDAGLIRHIGELLGFAITHSDGMGEVEEIDPDAGL